MSCDVLQNHWLVGERKVLGCEASLVVANVDIWQEHPNTGTPFIWRDINQFPGGRAPDSMVDALDQYTRKVINGPAKDYLPAIRFNVLTNVRITMATPSTRSRLNRNQLGDGTDSEAACSLNCEVLRRR